MSSHVYYMSGDAWKEGGIDATGKAYFSLHCLKIVSLPLRDIAS